jgi:hemoglobin-like flavoprotein
MPTPSEKYEANTLNIDLLVSSFLKIEPQTNEFAETFYCILFKECPGMIPLFSRTDMEMQKSKLIESLRLLIGNIHNPEAFASILKSLGHRHISYGTVSSDYLLIGDTLLQALEQHLGEDWNPEVEQAWTLGYQQISELMIEGARTVNKSYVKKFTWNFISNAQDNRSTSSTSTSVFSKGILSIGISIIAFVGYIGWRVLQTQPTNFVQPILIEQAK